MREEFWVRSFELENGKRRFWEGRSAFRWEIRMRRGEEQKMWEKRRLWSCTQKVQRKMKRRLHSGLEQEGTGREEGGREEGGKKGRNEGRREGRKRRKQGRRRKGEMRRRRYLVQLLGQERMYTLSKTSC
jgi:hypothetical protein